MCAYIEEYASVDVFLLVVGARIVCNSQVALIEQYFFVFCIALYVSIELRVGLSFSSEFEWVEWGYWWASRA